MSQALKKWIAHKRKVEKPQRPPLSKEERRSLILLRREARGHGATLKSGGRGGLSPSLVLTVLRRDGYQCKVHGDRGEGAHGGLTLHHKGGVVESSWLSDKGHKSVPNNLVTLCVQAHDAIHNKARAEGVDSSQVKPDGDK
jgi:5-methylcytosine-specific restriction endonuclease McrA